MSNSIKEIEQFCNRVGGPEKIWFGWDSENGWVVLDRTRQGNEPNGGGKNLYFERLDNWEDLVLKREEWDSIKFYKSVSFTHGEGEVLVASLERWLESHETRKKERERLARVRWYAEQAEAEGARNANRLNSLRTQSEWNLTRGEQIYLLTEDIKQQLKQDREAIRRFVAERNIKFLLHFSYPECLENILQVGLLPRHTMELKHPESKFSDEHRYDGLREASCLSVEFPNYLMLYKYRQKRPDICIFAIDVSVLWELPCLFTPGNAARCLHNHRPSTLGSFIGLAAFENLFLDRGNHRAAYALPDGFTTDPQAEVMVLDTIKPSYFRGIAFPRSVPEDRRKAVLRDGAAASLDLFSDLSESHRTWFGKRKDESSRRQPVDIAAHNHDLYEG